MNAIVVVLLATIFFALTKGGRFISASALARNGRPYEFLMLVVGYSGLQGAALVNVIVDPGTTLRWHLLGLLIALLVAVLAVAFVPHRDERSL